MQGILQAFSSRQATPKGYSLQNGLLPYKGRIYLGTCEALKVDVLHQIHDNPLGGHSGFLKTLHRVKRDFYWLGLRADVRKMVRECDICQRLKYETCNPAGLLQSLPIPEKPWKDVSMYFVKGLPKSQLKDAVLVVVDKFTKFVHFVPLSHLYLVAKIAQLYMQYVFKLHGMPTTIVSNKDPVFTSHFW